MDDFLKGIDLSSLEGEAKEVAELFREGTKVTIANIKSQSGVIAESAEKTVAIGNNALTQVLSGHLDSEGAIQIVRRSSEQLEDLARGEGNLIVSNSVSFLKKLGEGIIKVIPGFFGV